MARADSWNTKRIVTQCIIPRLDIDKFESDERYKSECRELSQRGVGGFCVFGGSPDLVERITQELQAFAQTPLIFCADFEYGLPMRLSEGTAFPHAMALGKADDEKITFDVAKSIALEAKSIGIDWNLAPVCDINSNKLNPVINIRSFGESTELVSRHAMVFINGTRAEKVIPCAKHFPGHGNTIIDSHLDLPVIEDSAETMLDNELLPFREAISNEVESIMIGHLAVRAYDDELLPASVSKKIITGLLRESLGYEGLIITDALDMKSITRLYNSGEAAVKALKAGANIALLPENPHEAIQSTITKADEDAALRWHLQNSANMLLELKRKAGLIPHYTILEDVTKTFMQHTKNALKYAYKAVEVRGDETILPLREDYQIAGFAFIESDRDMQSASRFFTMLAQAIENNADFGFIDSTIGEAQIEDLHDKTRDAELILFPVFYRAIDPEWSAKMPMVIEKLAAGRRHIILFLGNPYISDIVSGNLNLFTYSDSFASLAAAIVKLTGREQALSV